MIKKLASDQKGGGFGILLMGMAVIALILLVLVNTADYALYTYRAGLISKAIDYSVCAAVQEISMPNSKEGLSEGFDEDTGIVSTDNIQLDNISSDNAFYNTFYLNTGIGRETIEGNMLIAIVNPTGTALNYIIKTGPQHIPGELYREGSVTDPAELETEINRSINDYWGADTVDKHTIYVNGNMKTNQFKKRPYYIVVIKNQQIDGLFKKRTATFIAFKGAKIERKE